MNRNKSELKFFIRILAHFLKKKFYAVLQFCSMLLRSYFHLFPAKSTLDVHAIFPNYAWHHGFSRQCFLRMAKQLKRTAIAILMRINYLLVPTQSLRDFVKIIALIAELKMFFLFSLKRQRRQSKYCKNNFRCKKVFSYLGKIMSNSSKVLSQFFQDLADHCVRSCMGQWNIIQRSSTEAKIAP